MVNGRCPGLGQNWRPLINHDWLRRRANCLLLTRLNGFVSIKSSNSTSHFLHQPMEVVQVARRWLSGGVHFELRGQVFHIVIRDEISLTRFYATSLPSQMGCTSTWNLTSQKDNLPKEILGRGGDMLRLSSVNTTHPGYPLTGYHTGIG